MKTFTKILAMVLALATTAALSVGLTTAYLTDKDEDVNVMTLGNVDIEQHEYERVVENGTYKTDTIDGVTSYVLKDFTQGKPLLPSAVDVANTYYDTTIVRMSQVDSYGSMEMFVDAANAQDKLVTVENTGKTDAYVRTIVAVEVGTANPDLIRTGTRATDKTNEAGTKHPWFKNTIGIVEIDGVNYYVYEYVYAGAQLSNGSYRHANGILPAGDTTYPNLAQVYIKSEATNEDCAKLDGNGNGALDILVVSQAVQAAGFDNATTALDTAFGDITTTNHPWSANAPEVIPVITNPEELKNFLTGAGAAGAGDTTLVLAADVDLTGQTWTPVKVDGYNGADIVTIDGAGHTIKGLSAPLFAGGFAGGSGIVIKNLTIADSNIVSTNTIGSGAFIESCDSMSVITLENCHLINSTVTGGPGSRTGGLLGWTAGYSNVNDGPVKTYVTIENCSVIGSTITCDGSVGGIYGHAGNNDWTYSTVKNCKVQDCTLNSTDDGGWRVGVVVGTANVGELTISGITESGNTLTQTGKTAPAGQSNLYGRFVPGTTGKLEIDGNIVNP